MASKRNTLIIGLFLVLLSISAVFSNQYYQQQKILREEAEKTRILLERRKTDWIRLEQALSQTIDDFGKNDAGILIKDLQSNWEISFNKDKLFPSASVVKIPIMIACFHAIENGILDYNASVKVNSWDKASGSGILKNMPSGKEVEIAELLELMIARSDNTAANMLIDRLGFEYLNQSFISYGIKNTNLSRKMVDFKARSQGVENYTTAEDIALILEKIYREEIINQEISTLCLNLLKKQQVNDRIPKYLPDNTVVAHKTGLERFVCHDAGIVYASGGDFIICALVGHSETTSKIAKEFIASIAKIAFQHFETEQILTAEQTLAGIYSFAND